MTPSLKSLPRTWSLQVRLILLGALSVVIALVTACAGFMWTDFRALYQAKQRQLQAQAEMVAFNSAGVLLIGDADAGKQLLEPFSAQPTIDAAALYTEDGRMLASYTAKGALPPPFPAPAVLGHSKASNGDPRYVQDVSEGGERVGKFYVRANRKDLWRQTWEHAVVALFVMVASLAAALPLAYFLARATSRPILELASTADQITRQGDFKIRVQTPLKNEIGTLYRAFNALLHHVDISDQALKASQDELEHRVELRTAELQTQIRENERVQKDLILAKDAAEAASRAKSDFLANMSHEIRTPMNGVLGMTELVLDTELTPEQRESVELVKSSAEALMVVINDILDFSKIEAGKMELDPIEFSLRDLLEETVKSLALRAHGKGLELISDLDSMLPERVIADGGRLRQVLINLLGNAIKFTEQGEVHLRAELLEQPQDDYVIRFSVVDTGIGIPAEKQQLIFDAFSQADTSTTRKYGGTGLGLTISSRLVSLMGGQLQVASEPGRGSEFSFALRMKKASESGTCDAAKTQVHLSGLPVLVVDDNATNRRILDGSLRQFGARPTSVDSGSAALDELRRAAQANEQYAIVLIDAMMPGMDGFMLIERMRELPSFRRSIVMMLSSADSLGDADRCRKLGASSYLVKPVRNEDLRRAIVTAIQTAGLGPVARPAVRTLPNTSPPSADQQRRLRILLAEDNPVNQRVALSILSKRGHETTVVASGREALQALAREDFDVVLMDVQMPELDGLEATRAIRTEELQTGRHQPIIAMTAHAMKGDRERCLDGGMDDYVSKPIDAKLLDAAIARVLSRARPDEEFALRAIPPACEPAQTPPEKDFRDEDRSQILDLAAFKEHVENDLELMRELIAIFLENLPLQMAAIHAAIASDDSHGVERAAHAIKGALRSLHALRASKAAQALELLGRVGELPQVRPALAELEGELNRLVPVLNEFAAASA